VCGLLVTVWVIWEVMLLCHFIRHGKAGSEGLVLASSTRYCSAPTPACWVQAGRMGPLASSGSPTIWNSTAGNASSSAGILL
jgi:hypothetical protein